MNLKMILTDLLVEALMGVRLFTNVNDKLFPTLISKNTKSDSERFFSPRYMTLVGGEKPYRITWFTPEKSPIVHLDLDLEEVNQIINTHAVPQRIKDQFGKGARLEFIFNKNL